MKAAVIHEFGETPRCEDFPDPRPTRDDILVKVKAAPVENYDRMVAGGTHYSSREAFPRFPAVVGHSGVGKLPDGSLVTFGGVSPPYGTMAEMALVPDKYKTYLSPVPDGIDPAVAAAAPSPIITSLLSLKYVAKLQQGETVIVNGATGVTGKVAVQVAKMLGAGSVIGTGRNEEGLQKLKEIGAGGTIDLKQADAEVSNAFAEEAGRGYDVVVDFLWGHPTELLLKTLVPKEAGFASHRTRFVQIGESAGPKITLSAEMLRTSGLEMSGASNIPSEALPECVKQAWQWLKESRLSVDIEKVPLKDVAEAWNRRTGGKRMVVLP